MVEVVCTVCRKEYLRSQARVREAKKQGWKQFCSPECLARFRRRGERSICANPGCKKEFYRRYSEVAKVGVCYCTRSCAAHVNNRQFPKRVKRVKKCGLDGCENSISTRQRYCSRRCYGLARSQFAPEKLIEKLRASAQHLGRTPVRRELPEIVNKCVWAFGSWNDALVTAGLSPHRGHDQQMFRRSRTKARDGHECDSISEAIIDNWLAEHDIRHERNAPYPTTGHTADWHIIGTQIFIEYFGLANDSKRYDRTMALKRNLCKQNKITLIELYAADVYPVLNIASKIMPTLAMGVVH